MGIMGCGRKKSKRAVSEGAPAKAPAAAPRAAAPAAAGAPPPGFRRRVRFAILRRSAKVAVAPPPAQERTLIMLGCDGAGKSTLIAALRGSKLEEPTPTSGFDANRTVYQGQSLRLFDVGGGPGIRGIWNNYYSDAHGAIFLVDAADPSRFEEARGLLKEAYAHANLAGKPLLVLANKADLPQAISADQLGQELRTTELSGACFLGSGSANAGPAIAKDRALQQGLQWLFSSISNEWEELNARVERAVAEDKLAAERKKEERRLRLEKKRAERAAKEAAEAEAAKAAAAANGDAGADAGAVPDGGADRATPAVQPLAVPITPAGPPPPSAPPSAPSSAMPSATPSLQPIPPPALPTAAVPPLASSPPLPGPVARGAIGGRSPRSPRPLEATSPAPLAPLPSVSGGLQPPPPAPVVARKLPPLAPLGSASPIAAPLAPLAPMATMSPSKTQL